jgi:hypothetical protein
MRPSRLGSRAAGVLGLLVCAWIALAGVPSAAGAQDPPMLLQMLDDADGGGSISAWGLTIGPVRLVVDRRGERIVDQTGSTRFPEQVRVPVAPRPGDVVRVFRPGAATPVFRTTWAGLPSLDSCPVGATQVTGRVLAPSAGGAASEDQATVGPPETAGVVTRPAPGSVAIAFPRPLAAEDVVTLSSSRIGVTAGLEAGVARLAGECGRSPQLPAPAPYDARARLRGGRLTSLFDPSRDPRFAYITSAVGCAPRSRVTCDGWLRIETAGPGPAVQLAQEPIEVSPGDVVGVRLPAGDAVDAILDDGERIAVRETVTTWNQAGRPVVRSRLTRLRRVDLPYPEG